MATRNDQQAWTPFDNVALTAMFALRERPKPDAMAAMLGRTTTAISAQASRLGLNVSGAQMRRCLPCGGAFMSEWIGNRVCGACAGSELLRCA